MITVPRRYRFVVQDRDRHGNLRTYLRRPGHPKVRLQHEPGTDEFDVEYRAIIEGEAAKPVKPQPIGVVAAGSVKAAVIAYYGSSAFKQLDKRTQHVRRLILGHFVDAHGDKPFNRIETRHVVKWRDEKADTPEAANGLLKALRGVFKHAVATAVIPRNIVRDVPYIPSKGDGFHTWTMDEVRLFEAHWPVGSMARLALTLLLMTGQRRSDVVQLGQQHLRDGVLTFTQVKNRLRKPMRLALPVMPELAAIIAATPRKGITFLENEQGKPYTAETFGNRFRVWARAAGLGHCTPHGLRKAAAVRLGRDGRQRARAEGCSRPSDSARS